MQALLRISGLRPFQYEPRAVRVCPWPAVRSLNTSADSFCTLNARSISAGASRRDMGTIEVLMVASRRTGRASFLRSVGGALDARS